VKTLFAIVITLALLATAGFAAPTVTQVSNAASQALPPLQNSSIAQGSYFSIFGTGLGVDISTCGTNYTACIWHPYPLPTTIGGTTVNVTIGTTTVPAYIEFAAATQINAVMPSNTPPGTGTLTVSYNGGNSAAFNITVVPSSFGTFAFNQAGTGPGIMTNAVTNDLLTPIKPIKPGEYVTLWGTGLGPVPDANLEKTAAPTQTNECGSGATCPVTVWVGNSSAPAKVTYAGRSPYTAEDQIDFIVPSGVQGCYVQVAVQIGSIIGNFTSVPVDPNGAPCQDADGINYGDIQAMVSSHGKASVAAISLLSNYLSLSIPIFGAAPLQWDNDTVTGEVGTFTTSTLDSFQGFALAPSVGNCTVSPFLQYPPPTDPALAGVTFLDAGAALSVQGPNGTQSVPKNKNGNGYGALVGGATIANLLVGGGGPPFFLNTTGWGTSSWVYGISTGSYTISAPGGSNVSPFSGTLPVTTAAASFKWTNQSTIALSAIPRNAPMTITWTGGDPAGFVDITAIASTLESGVTPAANTPGVLVECIAPASAGTFTVPTYVLQSMPSTTSSTATVPPGELLVGPASSVVKITPPTGLDAAYTFYHFIAGQNVNWQ
jgi:uncharacterized protein (TIGR03437 family)